MGATYPDIGDHVASGKRQVRQARSSDTVKYFGAGSAGNRPSSLENPSPRSRLTEAGESVLRETNRSEHGESRP